MEEQKQIDWIEEELKEVSSPVEAGERLPAPVFEEGKITVMQVDASKQFGSWRDEDNKKYKAIIPCNSIINGSLQKCLWWLNKQNPVYKDVLKAVQEAEDKTNVLIKIMQTGTKSKTRYNLVKGD